MKQYYLLIIFTGLLFHSCKSEEGEDVVIEADEVFISEKIVVDESYPEIDDFVVTVMDQLEICTISDTVLSRPPCSNEYFRVFDYRPNKDWKSGFIIEMIPGLYGAPVHQIVVVAERQGEYKIVNQYLGHLIEMRTKFSGYNDLLIGYTDPDIGVVAIKHVWDGTAYDLVDVEEINNHFVKPEMKDSINNIFLPAFNAGH